VAGPHGVDKYHALDPRVVRRDLLRRHELVEDGVDLHQLGLVPLGPAHLALREDVGVAGRFLGRAGNVGAVGAVVAAAQIEDAAAVERVIEHVVDRRVQRLIHDADRFLHKPRDGDPYAGGGDSCRSVDFAHERRLRRASTVLGGYVVVVHGDAGADLRLRW